MGSGAAALPKDNPDPELGPAVGEAVRLAFMVGDGLAVALLDAVAVGLAFVVGDGLAVALLDAVAVRCLGVGVGRNPGERVDGPCDPRPRIRAMTTMTTTTTAPLISSAGRGAKAERAAPTRNGASAGGRALAAAAGCGTVAGSGRLAVWFDPSA